MGMMKNFIIFIILTFFGYGCITYGEYAHQLLELQKRPGRDYIQSHPNLSPFKRIAIENGFVIVGMTADEVVFAIGEPYRTVSSGLSDMWVYYGAGLHGKLFLTRCLYFRDGKLVKIQTFK